MKENCKHDLCYYTRFVDSGPHMTIEGLEYSICMYCAIVYEHKRGKKNKVDFDINKVIQSVEDRKKYLYHWGYSAKEKIWVNSLLVNLNKLKDKLK